MVGSNLPKSVDPLRLAAKECILSGTISLVEMPRLVEFIENDTGEVQLEIRFAKDEGGKPYLTGKAQAEVAFICQRCLQPMQHVLTVDFHLIPVSDEEEAEELSSDHDVLLLLEETINLAAMIEDELLLSLPAVPKHENGSCAEQSVWTGSSRADEKENPFDVLKKLKQQTRTSKK